MVENNSPCHSKADNILEPNSTKESTKVSSASLFLHSVKECRSEESQGEENEESK